MTIIIGRSNDVCQPYVDEIGRRIYDCVEPYVTPSVASMLTNPTSLALFIAFAAAGLYGLHLLGKKIDKEESHGYR